MTPANSNEKNGSLSKDASSTTRPNTSLKPPFDARPIPPSPHATPTSQPSSPITIQNIHETPHLDALTSLPTIAGSQSDIYLANNDIPSFLRWDLDLSRLNRIHDHLWMAGRPMRARPLHRYKMMGFDVLQTQQMDLHLLKFSNKIMVKPLGEYMLDYDFWQRWICSDAKDSKDLWKSAAGFLVSWIWLLVTPYDLILAHSYNLLPPFITWPWWKSFVESLTSHIDLNALDKVNLRFHYGDLRLGRINSIYRTRFAFTHFVRGYLYGYNRYVVFFQRKFGWIVVVFAFFSLVLAAMQVGASVSPLQEEKAFIRSCYGFVVLSMVSVLAVLGVVALVFVFTFLFNMIAAIHHSRTMERERKKKAGLRKERKDV